MYKVDLLKGEGLPIRSRPGGTAFACLVIAVPMIVGTTMVSVYIEHRVAASVQQEQLARLRRAITALAPALQEERTLQEHRALGIDFLGNVKTALDRRMQWSPIVVTVVENLPETLILTKVETYQSLAQRRVPSPGDPGRTISVSVPVRSLEIGVCGEDGYAASHAVRNFQDRLRSSPVLEPWLDAVTVSQEAQTLDGQAVVSYELNCVFKPVIE
ncbi:MAG: hypothetical protein JSW27_16040 [Phycisphaerales bacterium]|nr:MAG: hypothetical protein JSW27_16040 [Phycisphaerales bacterium]